ncbi:MAG: hypothetical protein HY057_08160 [Rhodospirillales bacterium]|nr:hypothetical protein [Rhodospirillales bacterium]
MNTTKILGVNATTPAPLPAPVRDERPEGVVAPSAIFGAAKAERDRLANQDRLAAERRSVAARAAQAEATRSPLVSRTGLVAGSFQAFVDLVDPGTGKPVARIFGPPEGGAAAVLSGGESAAYDRTAGDAPPAPTITATV